MESLIAYFWAVGPKWFALVTIGGLSLGNAAVPSWKTWANRKGWNATKRYYLLISLWIAALFWVGFSAWSEERSNRIQADRNLVTARQSLAKWQGIAAARQDEIGRLSPVSKATVDRPLSVKVLTTSNSLSEPRISARRASHVAFLKKKYFECRNIIDHVYQAKTDEEIARIWDESGKWADTLKIWISENMGDSAASKFQNIKAISVPAAWPGEHSQQALESRHAMLMGYPQYLENLEQLIHDSSWEEEK